MLMKRINSSVVIFSAVAFMNSCKDDEPIQPHIATIQLTVEDASCTEAWLKISLTDANEPRTVAILQDGQRVTVSRLPSPDSVFVVEGLLPRHTYSFVAQRLRDSTAVDASSAVQATTMDTTSHNFTWQIDTLGITGSTLNDVAIINDTLAYVVGEMYLRDSAGQIQAYNMAKWNGHVWELKKVPFIGRCSAVPYPPLKAIWAFSGDNILVTNGGSIVRYDGVNATMDCRMNSLLAGAINKIYGANAQDVYIVGNVGTIVHYASGTWQRIESGTDVMLTDVWGTPDGSIVWACGWEDFKPTVLLRLHGNVAEKAYEELNPFQLRQDSLSGILASVWTPNKNVLYVASHYGTYRCRPDTRGQGKRFSFTSGLLPGFPFRMRGNAVNDLFIVGEFSMVAHFNGVNWRYYASLADNSRRLHSVAQRGEQVFAVGETLDFLSRAVVLRGRR